MGCSSVVVTCAVALIPLPVEEVPEGQDRIAGNAVIFFKI